MLRKIASIGHPVLREEARALSLEELQSTPIQVLIDDMIDTMRDASGAGIAAPQVYVPVRVCVIEVKNNVRYPYKPEIPLTVLVNPEIDVLSGLTFANYEGCLSVPDLRGVVSRHVEIRVRALDRFGNAWVREVRGLSAGTFQHEVDHLQGKLFVDRVSDSRTLCTWKEFERHHQAVFAAQARALVAAWGA